MKSESDDTQPSTSQAAAATPATPSVPATSTPTPVTPNLAGTPYAGWTTTSAIPIDPALQQTSGAASPYTHYQTYSSHHQQAVYQHYQAYTQQQVVQSARTPPAPATASTSSAVNQSGSGGVDTADIATLNDALGSAGVDLKAEEESLHRSYEQHQSYRTFEDRTRKQPSSPNFDVRFLGPTIRTIASQHKITKIPEDSINYLALALRTRLQELITQMVSASHHRTDTQFDRPASLYPDGTPMWSIIVRSDVAKQLAALEKVEREEEHKVRRERKERTELAAAHAAALAQAGGTAMNVDGSFDEDAGGSKKKKKKEGPGVTAKNMSEDVRKKMSNAVATQAAGLGGKYAWMNSANAAAAAAAKPKPGTAAGAPGTPATTTSPSASTATNPSSSWARPYIPVKKSTTSTDQTVEEDMRTAVIMRDAMFVIEKERGHGGGRGAARGWV